MPRVARVAPGGYVYHAINRGVARRALFEKDGDFQAFERVLVEAVHRTESRLLGYCLMPNHWHLVLWPKAEGELTALLRWLTLTHTQRWHAHYHTAGSGHLYQGRFKAFPIEEDHHLLSVLRYVERNALRAGLCGRAEAWPFGSLHHRRACQAELAPGAESGCLEEVEVGDLSPADCLSVGPVPLPVDWIERVNGPQSEAELEAIRRSVERGQPFGSPAWQAVTAQRLGLQTTFRPRGRPRQAKKPVNAPDRP